MDGLCQRGHKRQKVSDDLIGDKMKWKTAPTPNDLGPAQKDDI